MYKEDCPREKYIPIYLIVAGCFGAVKALFTSGQRICQQVRKGRGNDDDDDDDDNQRPNPVDSLISCFLLAWFIAGECMFQIQGMERGRVRGGVCCIIVKSKVRFAGRHDLLENYGPGPDVVPWWNCILSGL